ncbi:MAG TPA: hypothetical protein VFX30_09540, partial [bacterium]|nr:hypothetical protein [bacterium]
EADDADCKLKDGRHLVTGPDGNKLNEGSALYNQNLPFLEGVPCNNANDSQEDDCQSPSSTASLRDGHPLLASRFSDLHARTDRYFYDAGKIAHDDMIRKLQDGGPAVKMTLGEALLVESNPECRIDLAREDASLIPAGTVTTRSLVQHGRYCLAVEGEDGAWTVSCKTVEAPKVSLNVSAGGLLVSDQKPVVKVTFSYQHAASSPELEGCSETGAGSAPDAQGNGHYAGECPLTKDSLKIRIAARGLGRWNVERRNYAVVLGKPLAVMKVVGSDPANDYQGELTLEYRADRSCTIKDLKTQEFVNGADVRCPWVGGIKLYGQYVVDGQKVLHPSLGKVLTAEDAKGVVVAYRDMNYYLWSFGALDFEGVPSPSNVVGDDFISELSVLYDGQDCSRKLAWHNQGLGAKEAAKKAIWECVDDLECYRQRMKWTYAGHHVVNLTLGERNLKEVVVECEGRKDDVWDKKATIYSEAQSEIQGFQTKIVTVESSYPVIQCRIAYQTADGTSRETQTLDSCFDGYDYGPMSEATGDDIRDLIDRSLL